MVYRIRNVQLIQKWVAVFGYRGRENDNFVDFANALEEGIDTWSLDYVDIVILTFNFNRNCKVGLV